MTGSAAIFVSEQQIRRTALALTSLPSAPPPPAGPDISTITIEEEMRRSYLDYAMSVIVSRALPDVRDGLKPVHRRILYSMQMNGNVWNRGYRKSARIVGDVMGKYHPHGNAAIYDAMVRLAQDFSMRLPLIDGQGNFGSMDGDPPAAERYTEARLARVAESLLADLDKDTVDFQPNYDETEREPKVLPAGFPNLLVNGAQGIAVGMATNIPPHNLGEVIDACCAYLDNPAITVAELMELVPAPDFPTGGIIIGRAGTAAAYQTGRGAIVLRARHHIEEVRKERDAIVFTEMPYQVNKARLQERIAECVREKLVEGIADMRDESDRDGVRLVIELKRDADADIVLNQLYRHTALQTSFGVNMLALNGGRPEQMTLRDVIVAFIAFREEVITRRTTYLLNKARERAHILVGLLVAVANIDEIIALIRAAPDPAHARAGLVGRRWPAGDIGPLVEMVGGQRRGLARRRHLPAFRRAGPRDPRSAAAAPDRARTRKDRRRASGTRRRNRRISRHPALARPADRGVARRIAGDQDAIRQPAAHDDRGCRVRGRYRGPDPARGHGRHGQPRRLHQARAAVDLSRAAPRRPRPRRHGDPRGGLPQPGLRRLDLRAGAVLHLVRAGLQAQGLPIAARLRRRRAAGRWSICCRWARARRSRPSCPCPRTRKAGPI